MGDLFDVIFDVICDFFGIEHRRDASPGVLRWLMHVLMGIFMILFGILTTILAIFRIRRMPKRRRLSWLWILLSLLVLAVAVYFLLRYFGVLPFGFF